MRFTSSQAVPSVRAGLVSRASHTVLLAAIAFAAACAGHTSTRSRGDSSLITREQVLASHYLSAYEVVAALRGNWLRVRGADSFQAPGQVIVYLDDSRLGGIDTLRAIAANTVGSIRFVDAVSAQARWGLGHTQGVIAVTTQLGS